MAASLAAAIKSKVGIESELVRGSGGIFDVSVDNTRIYSKREKGRFPSDEEIIEKLRGMADVK